MTITIETRGRRHYMLGNTYPLRDALRAAGAHWDPDARAWWTGDRGTADQIVGQASNTPAATNQSESLTDDSRIVGKVEYKGRRYILVWEGETRRGQACKLAFSDGSKIFWAAAGEVTVTKRYQAREHRGRVEHMTFGRLQHLRAEYATAKKQGNEDGIPNGKRYECEECGDWVTRGDGSSCWETGCAH